MNKLLFLILGFGLMMTTTSKAQHRDEFRIHYGEGCEGVYNMNANGHLGKLVIDYQRGDRFDGYLSLDGDYREDISGHCSLRRGTIDFYRSKVNQSYFGRINSDGWDFEFRGNFTFEGSRYSWSASKAEKFGRAICVGTFEINANGFRGQLVLESDGGTRVRGDISFPGQPIDSVQGDCFGTDYQSGSVSFTRYISTGGTQFYTGSVRRLGRSIEMSGQFDHEGRKYSWRAN